MLFSTSVQELTILVYEKGTDFLISDNIFYVDRFAPIFNDDGVKATLYYFLVCDNYLIFYTVDEETVSVDRVIHGKRDYCRMLFNLKLTDTLCENEQE